MERKIKAPVLWNKKYYGETFFDNSYYDRGKKRMETGDWSGVLFLYDFNIVQYKNRNRLIIKPDVVIFRGENRESMIDALEETIKGRDEWDTKGKNYRNGDAIFPQEAYQKLQEYNAKI